MNYLLFSLGFIIIHTALYVLAGLIDLQFTHHLYAGENRLFDFLRDMDDEEENQYVARTHIPAQIVRGLLMSVVLYPILDPLSDISFLLRFAFFAGLMFVYTDLASATPFTNIEGLVYLKEQYVRKEAFLKIEIEMVIYSFLFGLLSSWILF